MAAPLLLEYGGSRPVFTVQPWRRALDRCWPNDSSFLIEPRNARAGAWVFIHAPGPNGWSSDVPALFRRAPYIEVCTAPVRAWKRGREEIYTTRLYVRGRRAFAAAYRAARMIAAGRPVGTATNLAAWSEGLRAEIAPAHRRLVGAEMAEAFEDMPHERSACRVCGCTDEDACEGGCHWDQPDLCSACVGREKHGPCGGFAGECDWCGKRSRRLQLAPPTDLAECPRCREADGKEGN